MKQLIGIFIKRLAGRLKWWHYVLLSIGFIILIFGVSLITIPRYSNADVCARVEKGLLSSGIDGQQIQSVGSITAFYHGDRVWEGVASVNTYRGRGFNSIVWSFNENTGKTKITKVIGSTSGIQGFSAPKSPYSGFTVPPRTWEK